MDMEEFEIEFENREYAAQLLSWAILQLTGRRLQCLVLTLVGFTQEEIGHALEIDHTTVAHHWRAVLKLIKRMATPIGLETGDSS